MKQLSEAEREEILTGLKHNWEQIHHQYQGISVVTDTAPKKNRKERMEAEMKQLERDIECIEKHRVIYIANWLYFFSHYCSDVQEYRYLQHAATHTWWSLGCRHFNFPPSSYNFPAVGALMQQIQETINVPIASEMCVTR